MYKLYKGELISVTCNDMQLHTCTFKPGIIKPSARFTSFSMPYYESEQDIYDELKGVIARERQRQMNFNSFYNLQYNDIIEQSLREHFTVKEDISRPQSIKDLKTRDFSLKAKFDSLFKTGSDSSDFESALYSKLLIR